MKTTTIEPLETRIAPATLANGVLTYTDVDGDAVTIKFSKKTDLTETNFLFNSAFDADGPQQLQRIDLGFTPTLDGTNIVATVKKVGGGDGKVNIGAIEASGLDLGTVTIPGDLGRISAGDSDSAPGLKKLTAGSIGTLGTTTQAGGGTLTSFVSGPIGTFTVTGNVENARLNFNGGLTGKIGAVNIGGQLIGGDANAEGSLTFLQGKLGKLIIGGIVGGNLGDPNTPAFGLGDAGAVRISGTVGTIEIRGDLQGGNIPFSGAITVDGTIGKARITGDLLGATGANSGYLEATAIKTLNTGNITGGRGLLSGLVSVNTLTKATIDGNLSGTDVAPGFAHSFTALTGGIDAREIGSLTITGSILGGDGLEESGGIKTSSAKTITIKGSVIGGAQENAGRIRADLLTGALKISGDVTGSGGESSGGIQVDSAKSIFIGGDLSGGAGPLSGSIEAGLSIGSLTVGRDLVSGNGLLSGGIRVFETLGKVKIGRDVLGNATQPVVIQAFGIGAPLAIQSLTVGGNAERLQVLGGGDFSADGALGAILIGGNFTASSIVAGFIPVNGFFGDGDDQLTPGNNDLAIQSKIASVTIKGAASGTAGSGDHFAILAERVLKLKIGTTTHQLDATANNSLLDPASNDFRIIDFA